MHLRIDARPIEGLRLVTDVPLHRLGRLEGYNGIGKSAALRLLQVCVGDQPYLPEEQELWKTFRRFVQRCTVTLDGLTGGSTLVWDLDPDRWPDTTNEALEYVGHIKLNGAPIELERVRELLKVDRVVGNEGLVPTLVRQLKPHRLGIDEELGPASAVARRQQQVDGVLFAALDLLRRIADAPLEDAHERVTSARERIILTSAEEQRSRSRLDRISQGLDLRSRLQRLTAESASLATRERELIDLISSTEDTLQELDHELTAAGARANAQPALRRELQLATRNADRVARNSEEAVARCRRTARSLGLVDDPLTLDLVALKDAAERERTARSAAAASAFVAPRVASVSERLVEVLRATDSDLDDEVLVQPDGARDGVTIRQLRSTLESTTSRLRAIEPPDVVLRLQHETDELTGRVARFSALEEQVREAKRRLELGVRASERLAEAGGALADAAGDELAAIVARREAASSLLRELAVDRADVVRARQDLGGGLTQDELERRLREILNEFDAAPQELDDRIGEARAGAADASQAIHAATSALAAAEDEERTVVARVDSALEQIRVDERLGWVASRIDLAVDDDEGRLRLQRDARPLVRRLDHARDRAARAASLPADVSGALRELEGQLATNASMLTGGERPVLTAVREWFGAEVSTWFNQPVLRSVLFNDAETVRIDLLDMSVSWSVGDEQFVRPLTAFSSGEQAFAYTRARLAILEGQPQTHDHVIALDEFGAFMARNWLYRLESYLRERSESRLSDRLLLVLPLTRTEEELKRSGAPAADLELAEERGYFVTDLSGSNAP